MQRTILSIILLAASATLCCAQSESDPASQSPLAHLTIETFGVKVADLSKKEWKYLGDKPAIIDFYADWCVHCHTLTPLLEELAEEYRDKLDIYKIDTEDQPRLASYFGVSALPYILFIPVGSEPKYINGAVPKKYLEEVIHKVLLPAAN